MRNAVTSLTCLWFVSLSVVAVVYPKWVGQWQANVEYGFLMEAEHINLWGE